MKATIPFLLTMVVGYVAAGLPGAVIATVGVIVAPRLVKRVRIRRASGRIGTDLCLILELAARASRSGQSLIRSLGDAASLVGGGGGALIEDLLDDARTGRLGDAVDAWDRRHSHRAVTVAAATIGLAADGEGSTSRALEAGATMLRERDAVAREADAWAAQSRASATLLVAAPAALGCVALVIDPSTTVRTLSHPLAALSVTVGVAAEFAGAAWMRRLVRSSHGAK